MNDEKYITQFVQGYLDNNFVPGTENEIDRYTKNILEAISLERGDLFGARIDSPYVYRRVQEAVKKAINAIVERNNREKSEIQSVEKVPVQGGGKALGRVQDPNEAYSQTQKNISAILEKASREPGEEKKTSNFSI